MTLSELESGEGARAAVPLILCSAQPLNISVQNLGEMQMAEPSKQPKYPKQADTRTLNDKIWFQKRS